jgi:hypothetical protein
MKVAQHFSAGLGFLNARVPSASGTIEYSLVPATLKALPMRLCLSSLRDGVFFNLNPAMNCWATFDVSLRDSSRYRLPPQPQQTHIDADGRPPDTIIIPPDTVH